MFYQNMGMPGVLTFTRMKFTYKFSTDLSFVRIVPEAAFIIRWMMQQL